MRPVTAALIVIVACVGAVGCDPSWEVRTRYLLEKQLWSAQQLEKKIASKYPYDTIWDWEAAVQAYRAVLTGAAVEGREDWQPSSVEDIERIVLMTKLGLIRLCFLDYRAGAAVSYFKSEIFDFRTVSLDTSAVRLNLTRRLYASIDVDSLTCRPLLREIVDSRALSTNYVQLGDTLLGFPVFFAQVIRDNGGAQQYIETIDAGEEFYAQIIDARRDSLVGRKATFYRAQFRLLGARLDEAQEDVRSLLEQGHEGIPTLDLRLLEGRILGAQGRVAEAQAVYDDILTGNAATPQGYLARLNNAEIHIHRGRADEAVAMLRDLEEDNDAPQEVIARAALLRARVLERQGRWKDAFELLRWTCRLHPYTLAAVHAPLVALRHDIAEGELRDAENTLELATGYYLQVIEKDSAFLPFRHLAKDFLVESYLLMGREAEVAELLEREGQMWRGNNGSVTLLKSGLIYMNLLGDREKSAAALKKSVELFPQARYGKITQSQLDRIATRQNGDP